MFFPTRLMTVLSLFLIPTLAAYAEKPVAEKAAEKAMKANMVHYSGKVQGVGFRAAAAAIARDHPVTGWVKNLADGRVQLLVEGSPEAVEKFLKAVQARWQDNIEKAQVEDHAASGKFKGFEIVP